MAVRTLDSPLGRLTVQSDHRAITAITWGGSDRDDTDPLLEEAIAQLEAYFDGRRRVFDLPLAPAGTSFQQSVWRAMRAIGFGETRTYGELARELGSVARAVGGACGANPIPIVIPCHRVLAASGLGGFSGGLGVESKKQLLQMEGAIPHTFW